MKKRTLCLLSMALMLTIALTSCAGDPAEGLPEASPEETVPLSVPAALEADAQALTLYREYLAGERAAQEVLIQDSESGREIHFAPTTFQPPDLYEVDAYNDGMLWRVEQFTLSDLDGDGVRELLLYTSNGGAGAYEILTCCDGELYVNTRWPRGFRDLRTDGTFSGSSGASSIYLTRVRFSGGVMEDEALPLPERAAPPVDGEEIFLNGTSVSEATFQVLWAAQQGKTRVQWYNWSEAIIDEMFSAELEARALYRDFFRGETSIAANAVDYGDPTGESRFRAPDIYTSSAVAGNLVDRTIKRFALSDLDGDGISELILALRFQDTDAAWDDDYAILTCYDGTLYASERVFRGFLYPRADGTYEFSGGLYDNGVARACFKNGVMYDEETAIELPEGCQLNGETVSAETFSAFLALQGEKPELAWMALTEENLTAALGA